MRNLEFSLEHTGRDSALYVSFAATLHLLALVWNPVILKSNWRPPHDFVTVEVIEQNAPSAPAEEARPAKMSLLDTLKDMLLKPKTEEIAPAVRPVAPLVPAAPVLKEASRPRPVTPRFQPRSQEEEVAAAQANTIQTTARTAAPLPTTEPTLKTKAFGGIRAKDLPFQVSGGDEPIGTGAQSAIPIAVGNTSAKAALTYAAPSLQETKHRVGIQLPTGRTRMEEPANLATASPAPIALSGTGSAAAAPVANTPNLQERHGASGGLVNAALMGTRRSSSYAGSGTGLADIGHGAETQIATASASKASSQTKKAFEISGPLINRHIEHQVLPQYPSWAEEQGVVGSVALYFTVTPEGTVRPSITVRRTTGYPELDKLAIESLKQWRFAPIPGSDDGTGQWGIITFNFSLAS